MVWDDMDFKNLRRIVASCEGSKLYSKLMNGRKDQRSAQKILKGERRIVMLSKFGQVNMMIDLENGRRANFTGYGSLALAVCACAGPFWAEPGYVCACGIRPPRARGRRSMSRGDLF